MSDPLMIPASRWIHGSGLRCISCKKDTELLFDAWFIEPKNGFDSTAVFLRGWICDDCTVVHWAVPLARHPG